MLHKKIIFVGGKGGVGKSTTAAALALKCAKAGKKTLLVSTDPAHNIGHIFEQRIGGETTKVTTNLFGIEVDPERETEKYIKEVKENIKGTVQPTLMEEVHRQIDTAKASPGASEAALFDKLIFIILEESVKFDHVILDTAPTGHTIRLLSLPELMGIWIRGLLEKRYKTKRNYVQLLNDGKPIDDPIFDLLRERQQRFARAREIMLDDEQTGFIFVLNPERLPILETKNAIHMLEQYHLHVKTIIVNRVLPKQNEGEFFKLRKVQERKYLEEIERTFSDRQLIFVPYFVHDIINIEQLERFSHYF